MFKYRLKQVREEKLVWGALILLIVIATWQFIDYLNLQSLADPSGRKLSLVFAWLLSNDGNSFFPFIFLLLLIPLSSLPFSYKLSSEKRENFSSLNIIRMGRKAYIIELLKVNTLVTLVLVSIPLVWNLILVSLFFPINKPYEIIDYMRKFPLTKTDTFFKEIYLNYPIINILLYIIITIIFAVIINNFILLLGYYIRNTYILFFLSFIIPMVLAIIPTSVTLSPLQFLLVVSNSVHIVGVIFILIIFSLSTLILYFSINRGT